MASFWLLMKTKQRNVIWKSVLTLMCQRFLSQYVARSAVQGQYSHVDRGAVRCRLQTGWTTFPPLRRLYWSNFFSRYEKKT